MLKLSSEKSLRKVTVYIGIIKSNILSTIYWESSAEEKVHEFCKSGSFHECFPALFVSEGIFIHEIA